LVIVWFSLRLPVLPETAASFPEQDSEVPE
jgi:hypothetical protein